MARPLMRASPPVALLSGIVLWSAKRASRCRSSNLRESGIMPNHSSPLANNGSSPLILGEPSTSKGRQESDAMGVEALLNRGGQLGGGTGDVDPGSHGVSMTHRRPRPARSAPTPGDSHLGDTRGVDHAPITSEFPGARGYLNTASVGLPPARSVEMLRARIVEWQAGRTDPPSFDPHFDQAPAA